MANPGSEQRRSRATALLRFHRTVPVDAFEAYAKTITDSAEAEPGYLGSQVSVLTADRLDWAVAVTFSDEAAVDQWLDALPSSGTEPTTPLPAGVDIVVGGAPRTEGVGLVLHRITPGTETAFIDAQIALTELSAAHPGYQGTTVLPPTADNPRWVSIIRFRTEQRLQDWMASSTRRSALPQLEEQLGRKFQVVTRQAFGSTVRVEDGVAEVTPSWKTNMVVLLVLYPTVMLLARFIDPLIRRLGTDVWLTMFLSQVISVSLLTWVLMPAAGRALQWWLDPRTGASWRTSLSGALIVIGGYVIFLTIFGSVEYLQFWRH